MSLRPVVLCGPSGVGKGTLLKRIFADFPDLFALSVSHTTRQPREGEIDGKHYNFSTREEIERGKAEGKFIETAEFAGNLYGTSIQALKDVALSGKTCILEIDIQGAKTVSQNPELNPRFLFISAPSIEDLEKRLRGRATETEEKIKERMAKGREEMDFLTTNPTFFEKVIVNDDLETAYQELKKYLIA